MVPLVKLPRIISPHQIHDRPEALRRRGGARLLGLSLVHFVLPLLDQRDDLADGPCRGPVCAMALHEFTECELLFGRFARAGLALDTKRYATIENAEYIRRARWPHVNKPFTPVRLQRDDARLIAPAEHTALL